MSRVLVLNHDEVEQLLTMEECIGVMEEALASLARGEAHNPLRSIVRAEGASGFFGLMPAYRGGANAAWALKEICLFPGNPARGLDTHLGAVLLHSGDTGELLAIIGTGVQGRSHLRAIPLVRNILEVRVCSRTRAHAEALGDVRVLDSVEECVRGADIIVTATSSREPVIRREWVADGAHINAVGSSVASTRELDSATVAASSLFVDRRESTINESGDYLLALRDAAIPGPSHIRAELGEILTGRAAGRTSRDEITLFKSLGIAVEDLASAQFLFEKAKATGRGQWVEI
jgi:ornithine cyclodeaminase